MIAVELTPAQKSHAEWALDPMTDVVREDDLEDRWYEEADLPTIEGSRLIFPRPSLAVDDMLYRLTEQLRQMAEQAHERYPLSAETLARKIKVAAAAEGWKRTMGPGWIELVPE